jgi:hypothetical protein
MNCITGRCAQQSIKNALPRTRPPRHERNDHRHPQQVNQLITKTADFLNPLSAEDGAEGAAVFSTVVMLFSLASFAFDIGYWVFDPANPSKSTDHQIHRAE